MFTGIVEGTGRVRKLTGGTKGMRLLAQAPFSLGRIRRGDSISVNGCCLTVTKKAGKLFETDLSPETLRRTNLRRLKPGWRVNLERPLRIGDRLGGHLVQGHVDGVGRVLSIRRVGDCREIKISFPRHLRRYLIPKGSVTIDGTSMTVNGLGRRTFSLMVIPHTLKKTILAGVKVGDQVNLEVDMIGKYVESLRLK